MRFRFRCYRTPYSHTIIDTNLLAESLLRFGEHVATNGIEDRIASSAIPSFRIRRGTNNNINGLELSGSLRLALILLRFYPPNQNEGMLEHCLA